MNIDCLPRPSFQSYELPSRQREIRPPAPDVQAIELLSDQLARISPVQLAQMVYRLAERDHMALKRALLSSVRIRKGIPRD